MKDESIAHATEPQECRASHPSSFILHPSSFATYAAGIAQLTRAIQTLSVSAAGLGVESPQGREWYDLLARKLLPQLQGPPLLIVAIVGGTNIGKSVIFNHLAGETASASTPLAAGTKHPVCLVPPGCDDPQLLAQLFKDFELHAWQSPDDPLDDSSRDRIYWRLGAKAPPRLVLVDAPDVDSDATVNWQRARAIRQTADVLIALLTQQKYNDAAVKQFFRAAVEADKPIIIIFNFCDLVADRDYWPQWLARFCAETGAQPELIYVVPYDRSAAGELRLPFYRLNSPLPPAVLSRMGEGQGVRACPPAAADGMGDCATGAPLPPGAADGMGDGATGAPLPPRAADGIGESDKVSPLPLAVLSGKGEGQGVRESEASHPSSLITSSPTDLRSELAALHFDAIKIRTYRGVLARVFDEEQGLPRYLHEVRAAAGQFAAAAAALSATEMARVAWPSLPTHVLVEEMQDWWDADRTAWSRRVHGFYRVVGKGLMRPVRAAWAAVAGPQEDPLAAFQRQEQAAVVTAVEKLLDELARLSQVGNEILQPRLQRILSGKARAELLEQVEAAHRMLPPVDEDYRAMLRGELDALKAGYPQVVRWFQHLDQAMAIARPAITVTLFVSGGVLAGELAGQAAMHAAGHLAGQVAADAAIATGITEAVVSTTGEGARQAAARLFRRLQTRFAEQRAQWLADFLEQQLLGDLLSELRRAANLPDSIEFRKVEAALQEVGWEPK
jgi:hypothetical protein